nr:cytochrome c1-like [Misgurnus anguillicaudatus]
MNLSSKQAVEHRRLFEEALVGVEVSPSKPAEEQQPLKRRAKSKHGGKVKRAKRAASPSASPPDSPPSTSDSEEEAVRYQESGVSSLESPSSLEEYPTHLEPESSVADSSSSEPPVVPSSAGSSPRPAESPEHAAQEPATSEPDSSEPAASEPAASEPAASEPAASEPAASEPATSEPAVSEPAAPEPAARPKRPVRTTRRKPMVVLSPLKVLPAKGSPVRRPSQSYQLTGLAKASRARAKVQRALREMKK